jgi:hypothetical protein
MDKEIKIEELSIVVVAQNHNPTLLNPDFLIYNKIVPPAWELAGSPICVGPMAQVTFKNGVNIVAQFNKVIFTETVGDKRDEDIAVPVIARKYAETLPHVDYRAVGINPKGHVNFLEEAAVQGYILDTLLSPGPWLEFGDVRPKAGLKFVYWVKDCQFSLTLEESRLQLPDATVPVAMFTANFHRDLKGETKDQRLQNLSQILDHWDEDVALFKIVVNDRFLGILAKS